MPNELELLLDRESILIYGEQGCGKSFSVAKLIEQMLEEGHVVFVIDRDRGLGAALEEVFGAPLRDHMPENLEYRLANEWDKIPAAVNEAMSMLGPGDWCVTEMIGRFWDMAQEAYGEKVWGSLADHILSLRVEAQEQIDKAHIKDKSKDATAIKSRAVGYGGMEGRTDWTVVKRMHNAEVFDKLVLNGTFNLLATSSCRPVTDEEKERNEWETFHKVGKRPEGEKHQVHRFDTIAYLYRKDHKFLWRTDLGGRGKDRGHPLFRDIEFGDSRNIDMSPGFIRSYFETRDGIPADDPE